VRRQDIEGGSFSQTSWIFTENIFSNNFFCVADFHGPFQSRFFPRGEVVRTTDPLVTPMDPWIGLS
jgi:hypothetical protein